ncbi:MAG: sulfatase [Bacteroidetes bacterium]|nr:sulfatase [Fibrella sp.]
MKTNRLFILLLICCAHHRATAQAPSRPNVVLILVDELRWNALNCMGHTFVKTPHIDRIAREGMLMRNAFVTTPLCSPSRASILTGQYAHTTGIVRNTKYNALTHQLITYPRLLQQAGYQTAFIGKWHMGDDSSPRPGFSRWVGSGANKVDKINPTLNIDGTTVIKQGHITDILTEEATDFIKQNKDKPFSICLFHNAVHGPYKPSDRNKSLFQNQPIERTLSARSPVVNKPALVGKNGQPPEGDEAIRNQLRMLVDVDDGVGMIYKTLEEAGILDNTVIIFTSDNGYLWGEHGQGQKRLAYEESIRVPFLVRYPPMIKPGTTCDESVLNIDLAPTMLQLAGLPAHQPMQGQSLIPVFKGRTLNDRQSMLFEYTIEPTGIPSWKAVRTSEWKFIHYTDLTGCDELYDLRKDPQEMSNLIGDPQSNTVAKSMETELTRLMTVFK